MPWHTTTCRRAHGSTPDRESRYRSRIDASRPGRRARRSPIGDYLRPFPPRSARRRAAARCRGVTAATEDLGGAALPRRPARDAGHQGRAARRPLAGRRRHPRHAAASRSASCASRSTTTARRRASSRPCTGAGFASSPGRGAPPRPMRGSRAAPRRRGTCHRPRRPRRGTEHRTASSAARRSCSVSRAAFAKAQAGRATDRLRHRSGRASARPRWWTLSSIAKRARDRRAGVDRARRLLRAPRSARGLSARARRRWHVWRAGGRRAARQADASHRAPCGSPRCPG